jgi:hypothetical protein
MVLVARRLTAEQVVNVQAAPDGAAALLAGEAEAPGQMVDLDKSWHGIHFLLTGSAWDYDGPAGQAVLGGERIGADIGYGPARLLRPDQVRAVAVALAGVDPAELGQRYSASRMDELDIYPGIWDEGDVLEEYLLPNFDALVRFYAAAADEDSSVLLALL